jgi:hypothetical protein
LHSTMSNSASMASRFRLVTDGDARLDHLSLHGLDVEDLLLARQTSSRGFLECPPQTQKRDLVAPFLSHLRPASCQAHISLGRALVDLAVRFEPRQPMPVWKFRLALIRSWPTLAACSTEVLAALRAARSSALMAAAMSEGNCE